MNTRRIATAVGVTAGGALAAVYFSVGVAAADTPDITVGDGGLTVDGLTYTPSGPADYQQAALSYPPYLQSQVADQPWDVTDASGHPIGSFEDPSSPTVLTDWFGTNTTQFTVDSDGFKVGEIASALNGAGLADANFPGSNVYAVASDLLNDPNVDLSTLTGPQLTTALTSYGTSLANADPSDVAGLLTEYSFYDQDAYDSVLGDAGVTNSDFTGGDLYYVAYAFDTSSHFDPNDVATGTVTGTEVSDTLTDNGINLATGSGAVTASDLATDLNNGTFVDASTIGSVLGDAGFTDASFDGGSLSDVATAIDGQITPVDVATNAVTGADVSTALTGATITFADFTGTAGATDVADGLNGIDFSNIPADGTTYAVSDLGSGFFGEWYNVYAEVPGAAAPTVTDTLVTPFGDFDETWLVNLMGWDPMLDAGTALGGDAPTVAATAGTDLLSSLF